MTASSLLRAAATGVTAAAYSVTISAEHLLRRLQALGAPAGAVWQEDIPFTRHDPRAAARIERELRLPLPQGRPWRATLLRTSDQFRLLCLTYDRAQVPAGVRAQLAAATQTELTPIPPNTPSIQAPSPALLDAYRDADQHQSLDWAAGPDAPLAAADLRVCIPPDTSLALVLAAAGMVLSQVTEQDIPLLAALTAQADGTEAFALIPVRTRLGGSLSDLASQVAAHLHAPVWDDPAGRALVGGAPVTVGVLDHLINAGVPAVTHCAYQQRPYPLTLTLQRAASDLTLDCDHGPEITAPMARVFVRAVAHLLRAAHATPHRAARDLPLLAEDDQNEVLTLGQAAPSPARPTLRLDEAFAAQVELHPDAPALSYEDQTLSYREVQERAGAMARALRAAGVQDHDRVGVCIERSLDLVSVMLGILQAGATYVPMDPSYPADRLQHTVLDAGVRLVITDRTDFPLSPDGLAVTPTALATQGASRPGSLPQPTTTPEDAAYVIFTSGSTGKPKGVAVPHANVAQLVAATREDFDLGPSDTWTMFHSASFDFSVWEMWGALLTGGHLVVVPYWVSRDPGEFHELLRARGVTVLNQTPSAFTQLIEADRTRAALSVRLVIFGGEPLHAPVLLRWFDRYPERQCRLVNMFGITETTVHVTALTVRRQQALQGSRSVGSAIPGWHVYVLDDQQRLLPPGVPGEIYVGGAGVALGYLNRDELTRERFIPDPWTPGRMYRSGDKGRLRPDGQLEHLGRLDSQVKLRGFRIELEEIRHVLMSSPHVTAAAVTVHQPDASDPASARLDAYVTLNTSSAEALAGVRQHAARHLPTFMQPATLTHLDRVPLTANGKLDVRRLPPAQPLPQEPVVRAVTPELDADTPDTLLQGLFEQVLGVPVGLDDNFFELGGNSLYAVRISALLRERGLPALPLRELYVHQTVRRLSPFITPAAGTR